MVKRIQKEQEYEKDFYAWTIHNAQLLRKRKLEEIDIENISEEIESLGRREKRELITKLIILISNLLRWKIQKSGRCKMWNRIIKNKKIEINDFLKESPSLKKELEEIFKHAYERAIGVAIEQIGLDEKVFPKKPPFTLKECLKASYLPD